MIDLEMEISSFSNIETRMSELKVGELWKLVFEAEIDRHVYVRFPKTVVE